MPSHSFIFRPTCEKRTLSIPYSLLLHVLSHAGIYKTPKRYRKKTPVKEPCDSDGFDMKLVYKKSIIESY